MSKEFDRNAHYYQGRSHPFNREHGQCPACEPDPIKDLLVSQIAPALIGSPSGLSHNDAVIEAYSRGVNKGVLTVYTVLAQVIGGLK